jgi:lysophospholipase L1-like esterase
MSQLLEARYPSVTFEVMNAGANGQGSYRVSQVVEELVRAQPDLVVVAVGNNEGVVPLLGASRELNDWILYRFVKKAVLPEPAREDRPAWPVQALSPGRIEAAFVANVGRMVAAARAADVPLALATLPLNVVDIANTITAPELSQADPACRASVALAGQGQCDRGLEAGAACPQPFLVAARGAECLRAAGRYDEARELYEVAIQVDPRGRTRPSYNDALRRIARDERLLLVDLDAGMRARSPNGLPGSPPFIDAVHLTCMGYLPVARDIVETIVAAGLVHGGWSEPRPSPSAAELLERHPWDATVGPQAPPPGLVERTRRVCAADASQG